MCTNNGLIQKYLYRCRKPAIGEQTIKKKTEQKMTKKKAKGNAERNEKNRNTKIWP